MEKGFKVGDIVVLKSGGPKMTVDCLNYGYANKIRCCWFDNSKFGEGVFNQESLEYFDKNK